VQLIEKLFSYSTLDLPDFNCFTACSSLCSHCSYITSAVGQTTLHAWAGENVLLPCKPNQTYYKYLQWSYNQGPHDPVIVKQAQGQQPVEYEDIGKRAHLNFSTGSLQLSDLVVTDQHVYMCRYGMFITPINTQLAATVHLIVYGNYSKHCVPMQNCLQVY
jgi:hypothetical protein